MDLRPIERPRAPRARLTKSSIGLGFFHSGPLEGRMTVKLATDRRLATAPGHEPEMPRRRASETRLRLFSGSANRPLAEAICEYLGTELGDATVSQFADGETSVKINEN